MEWPIRPTMTNYVTRFGEDCHLPQFPTSVLKWGAMQGERLLKTLGIETRLQLSVTVCVLALIVVTPLGGSGGAPPVFFIYRTLLLVLTILCAFGSRNASLRISPDFIALVVVELLLMLISTLRIQGSHFESFYLWYRHAFYACAFLALAFYSRYQSARWKGLVLGAVVAVNIAHLVPDLVTRRLPVAAFSNNPNYFGTFLLIGLAGTLAVVVFGTATRWRIISAAAAALLIFGITQTSSRGATLAAAFVGLAAAIRAGSRIPRHVWLFIGLLGLVMIVVASPFLIGKFLDRGEQDPYNYARTQIWMNSAQIIAGSPVLGVGFGQYFNVSKRFAFPVEGPVARYLKRAQIAHSEYLQYAAEIGIPGAVLLFGLLSNLVYLAWKRAQYCWPEYRCFHEAALLTAIGIGTHAIVDNCFTIPVTVSGLAVLALADVLPAEKKTAKRRQWSSRWIAAAAAALAVIYVHSTVIPALGLNYNERGHQAFDRFDYKTSEQMHLKAVAIVPEQPLFLDNLGMVYLQQFAETKEPRYLELARTYFARAIASSPQSLDPHIHMETVLIRKLTGTPEQDRDLHKLIIQNDSELLQIDPYIPFARKNLAEALYQLGQRERAFEEIRKAIAYEPNYVPGYLQIAAWYRESGNKRESERWENTAVAIVTKYRDFKPKEAYEGILLGRPESSWLHLKNTMK